MTMAADRLTKEERAAIAAFRGKITLCPPVVRDMPAVAPNSHDPKWVESEVEEGRGVLPLCPPCLGSRRIQIGRNTSLRKAYEKLVAEGLSNYQIARRLGTTQGAVYMALRRYGLRAQVREARKGKRDDLIRSMALNGTPFVEIAREVDMTPRGVSLAVRRMGLYEHWASARWIVEPRFRKTG